MTFRVKKGHFLDSVTSVALICNCQLLFSFSACRKASLLSWPIFQVELDKQREGFSQMRIAFRILTLLNFKKWIAKMTVTIIDSLLFHYFNVDLSLELLLNFLHLQKIFFKKIFPWYNRVNYKLYAEFLYDILWISSRHHGDIFNIYIHSGH